MSVLEDMYAVLPAGLCGTMPKMYWPMMVAPSIRTEHCCVCGARASDQHHVVRRSSGELYDGHGRKLAKPTLSLCGFGNNGGCHGKAHANRLYFRYMPKTLLHPNMNVRLGTSYGHLHSGRWEFLEVSEPIPYVEAIEMDGWQPTIHLQTIR